MAQSAMIRTRRTGAELEYLFRVTWRNTATWKVCKRLIWADSPETARSKVIEELTSEPVRAGSVKIRVQGLGGVNNLAGGGV